MGQKNSTPIEPTFPLFTKLPDEIQYKILEIQPDFPESTRYISRDVSYLTDPAYYQKLCLRPLSKTEVQNFLVNHNLYTLGIMSKNSSDYTYSIEDYAPNLEYPESILGHKAAQERIERYWTGIYQDVDILTHSYIIIKTGKLHPN